MLVLLVVYDVELNVWFGYVGFGGNLMFLVFIKFRMEVIVVSSWAFFSWNVVIGKLDTRMLGVMFFCLIV